MRNALIVLVGLAACTPAAEAPQASAPAALDSAAAMAAAEALARRYTEAWVARDMAALGDTFTEDASVAFPGFPTTTSRTGIQSLYQAAFDALGASRGGRLTATSASEVAPGVLGVLGVSWDTFDSSGTDRTTYWRVAGTARQGVDGQWRFAFVMAFPDSVVRK